MISIFQLLFSLQDPYDLIIFITISFLFLLLLFFILKEDFQVNFLLKGKDFYGSLNQRRFFYFSLLCASIYKFICMIIEALIFSDLNCIHSHLCSFVRFSPDIPFLTSFSILITFWAQVLFFLVFFDDSFLILSLYSFFFFYYSSCSCSDDCNTSWDLIQLVFILLFQENVFKLGLVS